MTKTFTFKQTLKLWFKKNEQESNNINLFKVTIENVVFVSVYFYVVTILYQFGMNSFFNIPRGYIEPSLVANVTLFYEILLDLLLAIPNHTGLSLILFFISLFLFIYKKKWFLNIIKILALILLLLAYRIGNNIPKESYGYYILNKECNHIVQKEGMKYIAPITYNGKVVVVAIDAQNNLQPEYFVVDPSAVPNCYLEFEPAIKVLR